MIAASPLRALLLGAVAITACATPDFSAPEQPTEWTTGAGFRWRPLAIAEGRDTGFTSVPPEWSGVTFRNLLGRDALIENQLRTNGSGVALGDVDGDGRVDVFFARLDGPNALYRNLGSWRFEEITRASGLGGEGLFSTGAVFADVDGDRDVDLISTSLGGGKRLFRNDGTGKFEEASSLGEATGAMSAVLADIDGDRDLDLYITNYKKKSVLDVFEPAERAFARTVRETATGFEVTPEFAEHYELLWRGGEVRRLELGEPDELYLNDGRGAFSAVDPPTRARDWGLAAGFADLDADGDPDLFVANDLHSPDRVWLNEGDGSFRALDPAAMRTTSASTMALGLSDVDRDGAVDVFTVDMLSRSSRLRKTQDPVARLERGLPGEETGTQQVARNALLVRRADGTYPEIGRFAGVEASDWSWSVLFVDVDLDGYEDILVPNGHILDLMDADTQLRLQRAMIGKWSETSLFYDPLPLHNVAFRNSGGLRFEEVGRQWGFGEAADITHGTALADLDGDGDLDVVANRLDAPALVLRNDSPAPRLAVRLRGEGGNSQGIGATITVTASGLPVQTKEITAGTGYLSGSEPLAVFAMGEAAGAEIEVRWRDGRVSVVDRAAPDRLYEILETGARDRVRDAPTGLRPWFARVEFGGLHDEPSFDDFARQPLLPLRLSQFGPSLAWHDLDRDGDPELIVTAGAGSPPGLYRNDEGALHRVSLGGPEVPLDQAGVIPLPHRRGGATLLLGLSNYEAPESDVMAVPGVIAVDLAEGALAGRVAASALRGIAPGSTSATGVLAAADIDLDGLLDLFVGGRVIPGRYPEPASSRLLRGRSDGTMVPDAETASLLEGVGLVSGAVFTDYDADGDPDLVLALEWGPIRVLRNEAGRFEDMTDELGLSTLTNRWNGVTAGDFNGDGRPDLIGLAWGRNTEYRTTATAPLLAYFEDMDRNGTLDVIEAQFDERLGGVAPLNGLQRMAAAIPGLMPRVETHAAYADATVAEAFDGEPAGVLSAAETAHFIFWNTAEGFEAEELPMEAQWAPVFGAAVADVDGDGRDDVFLSQNFFATDEDSPRYDAGQGLWLRSAGDRVLEPVGSGRSGIALTGDQRGAAVADIDGDARIDLAVGQNGGEIALFRNMGAAPGLRVRLVGPPGNPYAIGSSIRIVYADRKGPRREIRAGSGTGSHDYPVQVLGLSESPEALEVLWFGGRVETVPLDGSAIGEGERDVTVFAPGVEEGGA